MDPQVTEGNMRNQITIYTLPFSKRKPCNERHRSQKTTVTRYRKSITMVKEGKFCKPQLTD